jgi:hypothetical protein
MSDNSNSSGCWGWLQSIWDWIQTIWGWIVFIGICYSIAIGILTAALRVKEEELPAWAYFVGLLLIIPIMLLVIYLLNRFVSILEKIFAWLSKILKIIFTWMGTILIGILLLIVFVYLHLHLWISVLGLIFLVIGVLNTPVSQAKESARLVPSWKLDPITVNSLSACFFGLVMIVVGIVTFFLDKGT